MTATNPAPCSATTEAALRHARHLSSVIGPRPSTSDSERAAHNYVRQTLERLGCATRVESFTSAKSAYLPYVAGFGCLLVLETIFWALPDPTAAKMLAAAAFLVIGSLFGEMAGVANPLRWLTPRASSQNVIGITPAPGNLRHRIAFLAHVDSHRTPWIWRSRFMFRAYLFVSTASVVASLALGCIFLVWSLGYGVSVPWREWSLLPAALISAMLVLLIQAEASRFSPGANDNASGVGALLALAEQARLEPLANTEIWWVATGCEEVGAYGGADFVRRHRASFTEGVLIAVDTVAGQNTWPTVLTSEKLLLSLRYPEETLRHARHLALEKPGWGVRFQPLVGGYSDLFHALKARLPGLTIVGCTSFGWMPHWHQSSDVAANLDPVAYERAIEFIWQLVRKFGADREHPP